MSYIESELEALEREQEAIDLKAGALEKKLRTVMGGTTSSNLSISFLFNAYHLQFEPVLLSFFFFYSYRS